MRKYEMSKYGKFDSWAPKLSASQYITQRTYGVSSLDRKCVLFFPPNFVDVREKDNPFHLEPSKRTIYDKRSGD